MGMYDAFMWAPRMGLHSSTVWWDIFTDPAAVGMLLLINVVSAALVIVACAVLGRPVLKQTRTFFLVSFLLSNLVGLALVFNHFVIDWLELLANGPLRPLVLAVLPPAATAQF